MKIHITILLPVHLDLLPVIFFREIETFTTKLSHLTNFFQHHKSMLKGDGKTNENPVNLVCSQISGGTKFVI